MSKSVTKVENKNSNSLQKITHPAPAFRNVSAISEAKPEQNNLIVLYKDLNQPLIDFANVQRKNLYIALIVFVVLGIGILMGQNFRKTREVASADMAKLIPAGAETSGSEHYHYDKSCYTGSNGEQVCMTRTSQKR